ncbi:MAG: hypothetical protein AAF610_00575 [Pseudomonadota bacterium]
MKMLKKASFFAVAFIVAPLIGCTTVGKGEQSLVPANAPTSDSSSDFLRFFPNLVSTLAPPPLRAMTPNASTDRTDFENHLIDKLGSATNETVKLSVLLRQRTNTPPFLPTDVDLDAALLPIFLNKDLTDRQKNELSEKAKAKLFNVPDLPDRTTLQSGTPFPGASPLYHYFPRVKMEFSSQLLSPSQLDYISYLGLALKLSATETSPIADESFRQTVANKIAVAEEIERECKKSKKTAEQKRDCDEPDAETIRNQAKADREAECKKIVDDYRIIDFQPKSPDIVGYTRGALTQGASLSGKLAFTNTALSKITDSVTSGAEPLVSVSGGESSNQDILNPELNAGLTESYVNALKDSIEARTAGLLDKGKVFFADFRSIKERRIGGTYDFDLMAEVPAFEYENASFPCSDLKADAYLVGVVRHVRSRGFTGTFTKVPEPENDDIYLEVVTEHVGSLDFWRFSGKLYAKAIKTEKAMFKLKVLTNDDAARFVVRRESDGEILGSGSGQIAELKLPYSGEATPVYVDFLRINNPSEEQLISLTAKRSAVFNIPESSTAGKKSRTVVGEYK